MPSNTVKVSRPSLYGNPFVAIDDVVYANPAAIHFILTITNDAAEAYRLWLSGRLIQAQALKMYRDRRTTILARLPELRGKNLACWCALISHGAYVPCHADVLLSIANDTPMEVIRENNERAAREALR